MVALSPEFPVLPPRFNAGYGFDCLADDVHARSLERHLVR
jgi:hypothetical protein